MRVFPPRTLTPGPSPGRRGERITVFPVRPAGGGGACRCPPAAPPERRPSREFAAARCAYGRPAPECPRQASRSPWRRAGSRSPAAALGDDRPLRQRIDQRRCLHVAGEELLELGIEAILRLPRLKVEKAEDEGACEAEQRGRERDAHAGDRRGEAGLERIEHARRVDPGFHAVDHPGDRMHRLQEAPESAEQAEKHQKADQIAAELAPLVEPGGDGIENRAGGDGRQAPRARPGVEHRRHRREQHRGRVAPVWAPVSELTQRISRKSRITCRNVNSAPIASTPRMRPFRPGLALKASAIC